MPVAVDWTRLLAFACRRVGVEFRQGPLPAGVQHVVTHTTAPQGAREEQAADGEGHGRKRTLAGRKASQRWHVRLKRSDAQLEGLGKGLPDLVGSSDHLRENCRIGAAVSFVAMGDAEISLERLLHPVETGEVFEAGKPRAGYVAQHAANDLDLHGGLGRKRGVESALRAPGSLHDARYARGAKSFAPGDLVR